MAVTGSNHGRFGSEAADSVIDSISRLLKRGGVRELAMVRVT
jgi:hypothetical protein